jgi:gliding motility-associated-like protein
LEGISNQVGFLAYKLHFFVSLALDTNCLPVTMKKIVAYSLSCFMLFFSKDAFTQTHVFAQLTGTPVNTNGWNMQGRAKIGNIKDVNLSEIILCDAITGQSGAIFFNQPIDLGICNKWVTEFDFRIFDGTAADGLAFCFLDVPPFGFVQGAGLGIPSTANGLKVCFDTYNNCGPTTTFEMPKVELRWGTGYAECNTGMPTASNASGTLSAIRSTDYSHAKINYDKGNIEVYVNGTLVLSGFQQFNFTGYLGFTASTGGSTDNHSIKNVVIYTDMPTSVPGTINTTVCPNTIMQLGGTPNPNYVYTWTPVDGISDPTTANPTLILNNNTDSIFTTKYYVNTAFATNPGCSSRDSIAVNILPRPKVNFGMPSICLDDALANFTDSSHTKDSNGLPFSYLWNFGDALNSTFANPNTAVLQNPAHHYAAQGNYLVSLKVTSNSGCVDSLAQPFVVNGANPVPDFNIVNAGNDCSNQPVLIQDNSSVDFGSITKSAIYWDKIAAPLDSVVDLHVVKGKTYSKLYNRFTQPATNTYQVLYRTYSGISCMKEITKTVTLLAAPKVQFVPLNGICDNVTPVQFNQATEIGNLSGAGNYFGRGVTADGIFDPVLVGSGIDTIGYRFVATNSCIDTAYQTITVWQSPSVNAGPDFFVLEGGTTNMNASATGNQLSYLWSPSIYLDDPTILLAACSPKQDTQYVLKVTDINGCINSDTVNVKVLFNPLIPNVFSPNGDNINDTWMIKYLESYPDCIVQVFTRSGQSIYHSNGYSVPWDGKFKGQSLPVATYYYIIKSVIGKKLLSGSVTIIR